MKRIIKLVLALIFMTIPAFALEGPRLKLGVQFDTLDLIHIKDKQEFRLDLTVEPTWRHRFNKKHEINFGVKFIAGYYGNFKNHHIPELGIGLTFDYRPALSKEVKAILGAETTIYSRVSSSLANNLLTITAETEIGIGAYTGINLYDRFDIQYRIGYYTNTQLTTGINLNYTFNVK